VQDVYRNYKLQTSSVSYINYVSKSTFFCLRSNSEVNRAGVKHENDSKLKADEMALTELFVYDSLKTWKHYSAVVTLPKYTAQ